MITGNAPQEEDGQVKLLLQNSFALLQRGELEKADELLAKAYNLHPSNAEVLNLLGIRAYQKQEFENALELLHEANSRAPDSAQTLGNIGLVNNALGKFGEALHFLDLSIKANQHIPETHNNRGNALKGLSKIEEALEAYQKAISLRPNYSEALNNQGVIFLEEKNQREAITFFERAIQANPNLSVAYSNLGNALAQLENFESAFQCFERAIQLNPRYVDAYLNFGNSLKKNRQYKSAIACYQEALKLSLNNFNILNLIGDAYYEIGESEEAKIYYTKSFAVNPNDLQAQFSHAIAQLPKLFKSKDEIYESRKSFANQLDLLAIQDVKDTSLANSAKTFCRHPFYIAYHEENNVSLLNLFGAICTHSAKSTQVELNSVHKAPKTSNKIRIGIVSYFFCDHPVWHAITKGWVNHLNPNLFEIQIFNTNGVEDRETQFAKTNSASYTNCGSSVEIAAKLIIERGLDALLFPEIGMDPTSKGLACLRLTPLQAVSWGHPETTGLPTIDFFLSASLLEPNEANSHYSEKLIQLPNLGTYFEPQVTEAMAFKLTDVGIDENVPILLCAGSPSKYTPTYDQVLVEIAKKVGKCQFVFFNFDEYLSAMLLKRLSNSFANAKLNPAHFIRFIPFLKAEEFCYLMHKSVLYLDTIGFSGFNTAMQAINCNLPIITIEGKFMRGRLASSILRSLSLDPFICKTVTEYIDLTVALIENKSMLASFKDGIHKSKRILFSDLEPIRALESFLRLNITKN